MATNSSPKPAPSQQQGAQQTGTQTGPQMQGEAAPASVQQGQPLFSDWASI